MASKIVEAESVIDNLTKIEYLQPKYGVTITEVQPAYGVILDGDIQPKYGVPVYYDVQPAYGVTVTPLDLQFSLTQIEENIATLKKTINTLKNSWDGETKKNLTTLDNSWVGQDCEEYTAKLTNMDKKVQNTISALELLLSTYEQVRDMVKEKQTQTISYISNIG